MNRKENKFTLLSVYNPATNVRWDEIVKPISLNDQFELLYKRWVNNRRKEVDSLSKGTVGYVHVRAMNDDSYRTVIDDVLGKNIERQSMIVHIALMAAEICTNSFLTFLTGKNILILYHTDKRWDTSHMISGLSLL